MKKEDIKAAFFEAQIRGMDLCLEAYYSASEHIEFIIIPNRYLGIALWKYLAGDSGFVQDAFPVDCCEEVED